ncbi:MAG: DMT family transporter [Coriobacteriia bacterium]|nr:DMT family transporter [Coriobacteriia bacterium]
MTDSNARPESGQTGRTHTLPILVALAVMVVWGGTPLFSKVAAAEMDPLLVGVLRTVLAACLAVPVALFMRLALPTDRRGKQLLLFSGAAAFIAFPLLFTIGQHRTSALHGALVLATLPVFTSLFGTIVERRRVSKTWALGCAIALASEAVVIVWRQPGASGGGDMRADLIVLASSVICALGYVAGARLSQRGYPALSTTLWGVSLSAVPLLPLLAWLLIRGGLPSAGAAAWSSVLVLALLTSVVGYIAWYWALAAGGIGRIASIQFTQPLFGVALAALILGERPAPVTAVAGAGILIGAWLVLRAGSRPAPVLR